MTCRLLIVGTVLLALADDTVRREWARFEGVWQRVSSETNGRKLSEDQARQFRLVLRSDGTYMVRLNDQVLVEGKAVLDPARKPKTVDMTPTTGRDKGKTLRGIYELDGDDYRLCYAPAGKERPSKFTAEAGSGHVLLVYKRQKP